MKDELTPEEVQEILSQQQQGPKDELSAEEVQQIMKKQQEQSTKEPEKEKSSATRSFAGKAAQSALMDFGDEIAGGIMTIPDKLAAFAADKVSRFQGGAGVEQPSFAESYRYHRDKARDEMKELEESNPKAALAGTFAGSALGAGKIGALAKTGKLGKRAKQLQEAKRIRDVAKIGALQGAAVGAGASEADEWKDIAADAAKGGTVGGVLGGAAKTLTSGAKAAKDATVRGFNKAQLEELNIPTRTLQKLGVEKSLKEIPAYARKQELIGLNPEEMGKKVQSLLSERSKDFDQFKSVAPLADDFEASLGDLLSKAKSSATPKQDRNFIKQARKQLDELETPEDLNRLLSNYKQAAWKKDPTSVEKQVVDVMQDSIEKQLGTSGSKAAKELRNEYSMLKNIQEGQLRKAVSPDKSPMLGKAELTAATFLGSMLGQPGFLAGIVGTKAAKALGPRLMSRAQNILDKKPGPVKQKLLDLASQANDARGKAKIVNYLMAQEMATEKENK